MGEKEDYDSTAVQAIYAACKEAYDEAKKAENPPSPESIAFFTNELLPLVAREMPTTFVQREPFAVLTGRHFSGYQWKKLIGKKCN